MASGKRVKLFLLRFRDRSEDKLLRSESAPSDKLQSLRSRDFKELNPENDSGNSRLAGSGLGR